MKPLDLSSIMMDYSYTNPPEATSVYYRAKDAEKVIVGQIGEIQYGLLTSILALGVARNGQIFESKISVATLDISEMGFNVQVGDYFVIDRKNHVTFVKPEQLTVGYVNEGIATYLIVNTLRGILAMQRGYANEQVHDISC